MTLTIDIAWHKPRRGDLIQTNVGDRRERTCLVLSVHQIKAGRFKIWCERWWQLEPDFRLRLYQSAERSGGQTVIHFFRYRSKRGTSGTNLFS